MKKLFFIGVWVLLINNNTGCKKNDTASGPSSKPSFYIADDSTTGIFNYTGIAYDSMIVIDSIYPPIPANANLHPPIPSDFHTTYKTNSHLVSGQIRIKKLTSDSTIIYLTRPINDNYDNVSNKSGMIFQTDSSYFPYSVVDMDTIIWAKYYNNSISIQHSGIEYPDVYRGWIVIPNGDGKFVNRKWEINYQAYGNYYLTYTANPMPVERVIPAYHIYHLTCIKQQ